MSAGRPLGERRAAAALASLLAAGVLAACDGEEDGRPEGAPSEASGHAMSETIPAQIDAHPHAFVSGDLLSPVTNAWRAASRERLTEVDAGALAGDGSTGAFAIFRHDFRAATQDVEIVEVEGSGPVRITRAPTGAGVEESAQRDGEIEFAGARGVRGTLQLSDDTVRLTQR